MKKTLIIFCFLMTTLNAQIFMRGIIPLEQGNLWKYNDLGWLNFQINFFVTDSTKIINNIEYKIVEEYQDKNPTRYYNYFSLSSDNYYIRYDTSEDSIYKYYKKDCAIGDAWIQLWPPFFTFYYTVIDTFTISTFGHPFFCKQIKITDSSLVEIYQVWSDSIGLFEENSIGQYDMILRGCVINGVLYGDTNTYVGVENQIQLPDKFVLLQNYPNPFNPSTNIIFNLQKGTEVQLKVYNLLGEEVTTLVNEYRTAGKYTDIFNGTGLPSGVYIYRLIAGSYVCNMKMVLLK